MGLTNVTGVLSRYFVLGFYVPTFFTLVALAQLLTSDLVPDAYEELEPSPQLAVLGVISLPVGLVLMGLRYPITRLLEGYIVLNALGPVTRALVWIQRQSYERLERRLADESTRTRAKWLLDRRFPPDKSRILPTRFGNAYRAFESYPRVRWGLDGIAAWPRIDPLLNEQERDLHTNAASDVAFFVNATLGAFATGVWLVVDAAANERAHAWWAYVLPFVVAYLVYRAAIGAGERVGTERRASYDLHRLELYERLGVRAPASFTEEREAIAPAVNRCLLYGIAIPDEYAKPPKAVEGGES